MGKWMPAVVLAFLLVGLACPAHAQEGEIPVQDVIVEDAPPPVLDPPPEPSFSLDTSVTLDPSVDVDGDYLIDGEEIWVGVDDITSPADGVDGAAILELLGSITLLLGYICVMVLFSCIVSAGKLIYSLFNMFF